jgi:hypothetical protein
VNSSDAKYGNFSLFLPATAYRSETHTALASLGPRAPSRSPQPAEAHKGAASSIPSPVLPAALPPNRGPPSLPPVAADRHPHTLLVYRRPSVDPYRRSLPQLEDPPAAADNHPVGVYRRSLRCCASACRTIVVTSVSCRLAEALARYAFTLPFPLIK